MTDERHYTEEERSRHYIEEVIARKRTVITESMLDELETMLCEIKEGLYDSARPGPMLKLALVCSTAHAEIIARFVGRKE